MSAHQCVMGCKKEVGQQLHCFPSCTKRRAEWCKILGISPKTKRVKICSAHFSRFNIRGNYLAKFSFPDPPINGTQTANNLENANTQFQTITVFPSDANQLNFNTEEYANEILETDLVEEQLQEEEIPSESNDTKQAEENDISENKVEDFEIRKGDTKDMIIKGRYVQTKDYLVVSYTPPRKWSLQEQVKILDKQCGQQLKQIRGLNKEKYRLHLELKKYEKLLPRLRSLQAKMCHYRLQLQRYKQKVALLRKRSRNLKKKEKNKYC